MILVFVFSGGLVVGIAIGVLVMAALVAARGDCEDASPALPEQKVGLVPPQPIVPHQGEGKRDS